MTFYKHEIKTKNGLLMAILFLNKKVFAEEFSANLENISIENNHIRQSALAYINKKFPQLDIKVVQIIVGKVPYSTFYVPN